MDDGRLLLTETEAASSLSASFVPADIAEPADRREAKLTESLILGVLLWTLRAAVDYDDVCDTYLRRCS